MTTNQLTGEALYEALSATTSDMWDHPLADAFASAMQNAEETHDWPSRWDDAWYATFAAGIEAAASTNQIVATALAKLV